MFCAVGECKYEGRQRSSFDLLKWIIAFLCPLKGFAFPTQFMQAKGDIGGRTGKPVVIGSQKSLNIIRTVWHRPVSSTLSGSVATRGKRSYCKQLFRQERGDMSRTELCYEIYKNHTILEECNKNFKNNEDKILQGYKRKLMRKCKRRRGRPSTKQRKLQKILKLRK